MKLKSLLLFALFCAGISSAAAQAGNERITVSFENVTMGEAISKIEGASSYTFFYDAADISLQTEVSLAAVNMEVGAAMKAMLAATPIDFQIEGKHIVLFPRKVVGERPANGPHLLKGRVTDKDGLPVIGATVSVNGTSVGVSTDLNGDYSLTMPAGVQNPVIAVSFIGYQSVEMPVGSRSVLDVTLADSSVAMDEVVVVGFATQKKVNLTGAVGTMDSKAFESVPVHNAVQALQGKVAGLQITSPSGQLDAQAGIQIRGLATIGEGSYAKALVLIDGMEGDIYSINPQDIESVSVLKDAAASSIYGSRAPFGVILVTTKSGAKDRFSINYNNSFRFNTPINMPSEMDSYTWATFVNDAARNSGQSPWIADETMQRIRDYMDGKISYTTVPLESNPAVWNTGYDQSNDNIDYYDVFYKPSSFDMEHNLSLSGSTEHCNYYVSGNYLTSDGYMRWGGDGKDRYNASARFGATPKKWLELSYQGRFTRTDYEKPAYMNDEAFFSEIGRQSWPIGPLYDPNGLLFNDHVLRLDRGGRSENQQSILSQQLSLVIKPLEGWRIVGDINYRYTSVFNHEHLLPVSQYGVDGVTPTNTWYRNYVSEQVDKNDYMNYNITTDYEKSFDSGHYFKVLVGFQAENSRSRYFSALAQGIIADTNVSIDGTSGFGQDGKVVAPTVGGGYNSYSTAGFFGRVNYNYKEKYLLEANFRADGSSRFRKGSRWGYFPSVSVGWNIAKESFISDNTSAVDVLKLRASYGSLGNQYTSSLYPTYAPIGYKHNGSQWLIDNKLTNAAWAPSLVSPTLTWETIVSANVGLDWAFLNSRLTGSFDWFVRDTKNMIGPSEELPAILGTAVPPSNNTDLRTQGFEFEISWKDAVGKDFQYGVRFVLSDATSKITRYSNPSRTLDKFYAGMQWGEIWGYETIGIAKTDAQMQQHLASLPNGGQSILGMDWTAGDIMYKDLNGNGKIDGGANTIDDHGDRKVIGNSTPRFNFGLDLFFNWKGIDFSAFFQGVGKRDYFHDTFFFWGARQGIWWTTSTTVHEDYFRDDPNHYLGLNLDGYYPRPLWGTFKNLQVQSRYLQNAAYLRLKNLQIGYTLPERWTRKISVEKLRIFFSGENLFTLTKMSKLFDPETIGANTCIAYPLSRTYSFGVSITIK